ncbi:site-specific DNA-methyltransferase [Moraxella sp. K127]|uniref:site-specific DNA-methyltransferase n=1 Tax=Moraxella sp. K127 TaxID=2780079 RepID=UPI00187F44A6|nr:site-specific DNA-methyltransferase [Moraxella sp. K127]MBE9590575.1 site-specific DNA-methyltransferase [Moraxella sp. K127]
MTLKLHSPDLTCQNIAKIAELFPNVLTEHTDEHGNTVPAIDFELLRQELSSSIVEGSQERYRLDWVGKREAILTANRPIYKTLRPYKDESVQFDTTQNLFIEGDNLDALKLLQDTYLGAVKMIYIDPPYNTGNDFIYNDDFATDSEDYLAKSEQYDDIGNRLTINTESNGRFHSDWLSMMYARLKLARNLLSEQGLIFLAIGEEECCNLQVMANEVFGRNNYYGTISWTATTKAMNAGSAKYKLQKSEEYIHVYGRVPMQEHENFHLELKGYKEYPFVSENGDKYRLEEIQQRKNIGIKRSEKMVFEILGVMPQNEYRWTIGFDTAKQLEKNGDVILQKGKVIRKIYEKDESSESHFPLWANFSDGYGTSETGKALLREILGKEHGFETVKPIELIEKLLFHFTSDNDIILDFFAGSGTTAHAVMQMNAKNKNSHRQFIMVQVNEPTKEGSDTHKAGYKTISDLTKDRLRLAGAKISTDHPHVDTGFRVLKIDSSNMKDVYYQPHALTQADLVEMTSHIKDDRTDEDLLFQVMLDFGVPLSLPIDCRTIDGQNVYFVAGNSLVACFDGLSTTIVDEVAKVAPLRFVSSERAIAYDQDKTNIKERFGQLSAQTDVRFI